LILIKGGAGFGFSPSLPVPAWARFVGAASFGWCSPPFILAEMVQGREGLREPVSYRQPGSPKGRAGFSAAKVMAVCDISVTGEAPVPAWLQGLVVDYDFSFICNRGYAAA